MLWDLKDKFAMEWVLDNPVTVLSVCKMRNSEAEISWLLFPFFIILFLQKYPQNNI